MVTYVNKRGERSTLPLNQALESNNAEMTKRLKYTKDILTHMLNNNNVAAGGGAVSSNRGAGGPISSSSQTNLGTPHSTASQNMHPAGAAATGGGLKRSESGAQSEFT
jgi:hypothetical protein